MSWNVVISVIVGALLVAWLLGVFEKDGYRRGLRDGYIKGRKESEELKEQAQRQGTWH
jgi:hypothetical protein